ncbi:MAG: class I SAM-dependent methyltransferase [Myxococcales bacterium FL481]|nr:MAG: class I SAM-dependent methyltransferase [Myxococcales bacterium FL481]
MRSYTQRRVGPWHRLKEVLKLYQMHVHDVPCQVRELLADVANTRRSIEALLGGELVDKRVLEIGPGQKLKTATILAHRNCVTAIDLDFVARDYHVGDYMRMLRDNGAVRAGKTLARKVLGIDRVFERELLRALEIDEAPQIQLLRMDAAKMAFDASMFDCVVSFSVFEHLRRPAAVLDEVKRVLFPGGVACVYVHLFTSETGAHDVRVLSGQRDGIPYWAHLRPEHRHLVRPNSYLNEVRLGDWRALFDSHWPGARFELFREPHLQGELARVRQLGGLANYEDDELLSSVLAVLWKKPPTAPHGLQV